MQRSLWNKQGWWNFKKCMTQLHATAMLCSQSVTIDLLMYIHIRKYQQYISDNIYIYKLSAYDTHTHIVQILRPIYQVFSEKAPFSIRRWFYFLDKHLKYPVFLYWTILHEKRKWVLLIDTPRDHNSWPRDKVSCELCTNSSDIRLYLKKFLKIPN